MNLFSFLFRFFFFLSLNWRQDLNVFYSRSIVFFRNLIFFQANLDLNVWYEFLIFVSLSIFPVNLSLTISFSLSLTSIFYLFFNITNTILHFLNNILILFLRNRINSISYSHFLIRMTKPFLFLFLLTNFRQFIFK